MWSKKFNKTNLCLFLAIIIIISLLVTEIDDDNKFDQQNEETPVSQKERKWWQNLLCKSGMDLELPSNNRIDLKEFNKDILPHTEDSKNIYLIEDNCNPVLPWKTLCSVESNARANPQASIFLLTVTTFLHDPDSIVASLLDRLPNIVVAYVDIDKIFEGTPLNAMRSEDKWTHKDNWIYSHMSDAVRIVLVWLSGGTYLDSDIIATRRCPQEKQVLVNKTRNNEFTSSYFRSHKHSVFLKNAMEVFVKDYEKNIWGANGPLLIEKIYAKLCKDSDSLNSPCFQMRVLNYTAFSKTTWKKGYTLFLPRKHLNISEYVGDSYGVHYFNHLNEAKIMKASANSIFEELSRKYCPFMHEQKSTFLK